MAHQFLLAFVYFNMSPKTTLLLPVWPRDSKVWTPWNLPISFSLVLLATCYFLLGSFKSPTCRHSSWAFYIPDLGLPLCVFLFQFVFSFKSQKSGSPKLCLVTPQPNKPEAFFFSFSDSMTFRCGSSVGLCFQRKSV